VRHLPGGDGAYYSVDGYPRRDGLHAVLDEMIDVDDDAPEDFVQFEREEMDSKAFAAVRGLSRCSCRYNLIALHEINHRRDGWWQNPARGQGESVNQ
jgi:hypothetical protein